MIKRTLFLILIVAMLIPVGIVGANNTPDSTTTIEPTQATAIVITTANLNIRSQPRTSAPKLQTAPRGTSLVAVGRTADTSWLQVEFRGVVGWASRFYVETNDSLSGLGVTDGTDETVEPRPQEQVSAGDGTIVNTGELIVFSAFSRVNIRATYNEEAAQLGQLQVNERATVNLLSPDRTWGFVNAGEASGWVALYAVNVLGDIRTVAVEGDAGSGSDLPIETTGNFDAETRQIIQNAQDYYARYIGGANTLIGIFENAISSGFISCGPVMTFFRPYRPTNYEYERVPELEGVVNAMNNGFDILNRARAPWLTSCENRTTITSRDQWPGWLATAREGAAIVNQAQASLAALSSR